MKKRYYLFILLLTLAIAPAVSAHGLATSKNQTVDNYLVEFEYDTTGNPAAGDFQVYNFDILDANTKEFKDFDTVFYRIEKKKSDTTFASTIANGKLAVTDAFGKKSARAGLTISESGEYGIELTFYDKSDEKIVNTTFDFIVDPPYKDTNGSFGAKKIWVWALIIGLLVGSAMTKGLEVIKKRKD